mmetsp:Transcript_57976/g.172350  ORF Transcript_57976/g.172350 Transcript_57976/m.172350 type:complete len:89 (-) Transcript_57976:192-458(-)
MAATTGTPSLPLNDSAWRCEHGHGPESERQAEIADKLSNYERVANQCCARHHVVYTTWDISTVVPGVAVRLLYVLRVDAVGSRGTTLR